MVFCLYRYFGVNSRSCLGLMNANIDLTKSVIFPPSSWDVLHWVLFLHMNLIGFQYSSCAYSFSWLILHVYGYFCFIWVLHLSAVFLFQASPPVTLDGRRLSIEERRGKSAIFFSCQYKLLKIKLATFVYCFLWFQCLTDLCSRYAA